MPDTAPLPPPDGSTTPVPNDLTGLWRREEIFTPSGFRDAVTRVFWLQTPRVYADIRIPADRPSHPGATSFAPYTDEELIELAAMQGFAGVLTAHDDVCLWRRDVDYQPPGAVADEAKFEIDGDRMAELGIHADYTEIWRREPASRDPLAAFRRVGSVGGVLVIAGDHFIEIEGRGAALPDGEDLAAIVSRRLAQGRRDQAIADLGMRICYGRIAGAAAPWRVELSTLPWLEGGPLFRTSARFDASGGRLATGTERWNLVEANCPPAELERLFER